MPWQYTPYTLPLVLFAAVSAIICGFSLRNRSETAARAFIIFMAAIAEWQLAYILQLSAVTLSSKLLWNFVVYVGAVVVPAAWLVFALQYTGRSRYVTRRTLAGLTIVPLISLGLLWTNESHHLVFASQSLDTNGSFVALHQQMGVWHWVLLAYLYTQVVIAVLTIIDQFFRSTYRFRVVAGIFLIASLAPFVSNIAYFAGVVRINPTPIAFGVTALALAISLYRYELFDIVPIAHEMVIQHITDPIVIFDTNERIAEMNDAAKTLFEIKSEFVGRPAKEILGEVYTVVADFDSDEHQEHDTVLEVGEYRYFNVRLMPITDHKEAVIGKIAVFRDVTESRRAEKRFELLIENVTDVITVIEADGTVRFQSQAFEHVLGYDASTVIGKTLFDLIHPDDLNAVVESFADGIQEFGRITEIEARFRHADGSWRMLELHGKNLLDHPVIQGAVITSRDVTERERNERELQRQNERLEKFASVVSHDLRNPLTVAIGRLDIARETDDDRHYEAISRAHTRMERIIHDVLTLARQGETVGEKQSLSLDSTARHAWENVETGTATLHVDTDHQIEADESRIGQLFENLFRNSVEHGGAGVIVRVGVLADGAGFYIEDTGSGIPPDERSRIFGSGYTTNPNGTGFGLAIVKEIAVAHGWEITVTDGADGGARFEIIDSMQDDMSDLQHA